MSEKDKIIYSKQSALMKACLDEPLKFVKNQNYGLRKLKHRMSVNARRKYFRTF